MKCNSRRIASNRYILFIVVPLIHNFTTLPLVPKPRYYHCFATNVTTWSPPSQYDLDVFEKEKEDELTALGRVPESVPAAHLGRRAVAALADAAVSTLIGTSVGALARLFRSTRTSS